MLVACAQFAAEADRSLAKAWPERTGTVILKLRCEPARRRTGAVRRAAVVAAGCGLLAGCGVNTNAPTTIAALKPPTTTVPAPVRKVGASANFAVYLVPSSVQYNPLETFFQIRVSVRNFGTKAGRPWCETAILDGRGAVIADSPVYQAPSLAAGASLMVKMNVRPRGPRIPQELEVECSAQAGAAHAGPWTTMNTTAFIPGPTATTTTRPPANSTAEALVAWATSARQRQLLGRIRDDLSAISSAAGGAPQLEACTSLQQDTTAEMDAQPAPDSAVQADFLAAMTDFSIAASNCVQGVRQGDASLLGAAIGELAAGNTEFVKGARLIEALAASL